MREYDQSGKQHTTAALEEAGFAVSQRVLHKKTKQEGEIVAMTSEKVTINLDSKTTMTVGAQDFLMGQWQTVKAKAPIEFLAWEDREPFKSVEVSVMELQAGACLALCEAAKKKSLEGLIALQTKHKRRDCSKGDLEACLADHSSDLKDSGAGGHERKTDSAFGDLHGPEEDRRSCL